MKKFLGSCLRLAFLSFLILSVPKAHQHSLRGLARVYTGRVVGIVGGGTGFQVQVIGGNKYIVTNSHVCDTSLGIPFVMSDIDGQIHQILYQSFDYDICLLSPSRKVGGLILGFDPIIGQDAYILGYPELMPLHLSKGEVMAFIEGDEKFKDYYQKNSYYISAQVLPGNSGSPVLNAFGQVIGILWGGRRDIFWSLVAPVSDIRKVIETYEKGKAHKQRKMPQMRRNLQPLSGL